MIYPNLTGSGRIVAFMNWDCVLGDRRRRRLFGAAHANDDDDDDDDG